MKYHGCNVEFADERNAELMRAYRAICASMPYISRAAVGQRLVEMPASRFWVSEERASVVVAALMAGRPVLESMRPSKREMFSEIYARVCDMMLKYPDLSRFECVSIVVNSPAPKFYMAPSSAMETITKIKNGYFSRRYCRYRAAINN